MEILKCLGFGERKALEVLSYGVGAPDRLDLGSGVKRLVPGRPHVAYRCLACGEQRGHAAFPLTASELERYGYEG